MNNKGQSLVVFVALIPVLLMLAGIIIDVAQGYVNKKEITSTVKYAIEYGFESKENKDELKSSILKILNKNIKNIDDYEIEFDDNKLKVSVSKKVSGVFSKLFDNPINNIKVTYIGHMKDDKVIIERG